MALAPGSTLGTYAISDLIGAGGMGEVYRARDTKLDREVAIKVLPEELVSDEERLTRFEREAKSLAALNHPNIATVHGFERQGDTQFLVMELVEGQDLTQRLKRGPIPIDEAIPLFVQVCEGLEEAHANGIVHRDLKPSNLRVSAEGRVKILDFGLAKAMQPDVPEADLTHSPTLTAAATRQGVIMGTAPYMSPEQARGEEADWRSDIWSFGSVLFEALVGRRPFGGPTVTDILAGIVKDEPRWDELPEETPVSVRRVLRRCLTKSPRERLQAIGDARIELSESLEEPVPASERDAALRRRRSWAPVFAVVVLAAVAGAAVTWWATGGFPKSADFSPAAAGVTRTTLELPEEATLALGRRLNTRLLAISPDGTELVYVGDVEESTLLYLRSLDTHEITPLTGTEGAQGVFFSPDGHEVGFFTASQVKKISLQGGAPMALCEATLPRIGVWGDNGRIYFRNPWQAEMWVSADGGPRNEVSLIAPDSFGPGAAVSLSDVLPGGERALVSVGGDNSVSTDYDDIYLVSLDTLDATLLVESGYEARFVDSGHIIFARAGHLMAVAFDLDRLEVVGDPVSVVSDVAMHSFHPHAHFAVSATGTLAYAAGGDFALGRLAWIDRHGEVEFLPVPERLYGRVDVSADGSRIAVQVSDVTDYIWVWDLEREEGRRVVMEGPSGWPALDAGGQRVAFGTRLADGWGIAVQALEGHAEPQVVFSLGDANPLWVSSWTSDGRMLAFFGSNAELFEPVPAKGIDGLEVVPALYSSSFSPNGRWLVYPDDVGIERQIWARSMPDGDTLHKISVDWGGEPIWCDECNEIFYTVRGDVMSTRVTSDTELTWERPTKVFEADFISTVGRSKDVSPDGQRILVSKRARETERRRIVLVQNWFEELQRLVPTE